MKIIFTFYICTLFLYLGCNYKSQAENLKGKWKCVRLDKSLSTKSNFEEFKQRQIVGTTFEFNKTDILEIIQDNDTSRHYYTLSADNKFLMYELFGGAASLHKIILLNKDSFKISMNFDDTIVFTKLK
jgi:hypothetical protein